MHALDRHAHTNALHARHAAEKMLAAGGTLLLAWLVPPLPGGVIIIALMLLATVGLARIPWRDYLQAVLAPLGFLLAGAVTLGVSLSVSPQGHWHLGWAPDGGVQAIQVTVRAMACVTCLLFLAFTTPITTQLTVLQRLRLPASLLELALLIYRFIFLLLATVETIWQAQTARLGYATWRTSYRALSMLAATFFHHALAHARQMEHGLAARGWHGALRTLAPPTRLSGRACLLILAGQIALGAVLLCWK